MQVVYETFGCNDGNVFFMGIDKGNTNEDVIAFNLAYGIEYPSVSGQEGGGNEVHFQYEIQATPSIVVIMPDRSIAFQQIYPPSSTNVIGDVTSVGGIQQSCVTNTNELYDKDLFNIGPNPVKGNAYIYLKIEQLASYEVIVYDLTGKEVTRVEPAIYQPGNHVLHFDLSDRNNGFYFVQLKRSGKVIATQKLVLSK